MDRSVTNLLNAMVCLDMPCKVVILQSVSLLHLKTISNQLALVQIGLFIWSGLISKISELIWWMSFVMKKMLNLSLMYFINFCLTSPSMMQLLLPLTKIAYWITFWRKNPPTKSWAIFGKTSTAILNIIVLHLCCIFCLPLHMHMTS